ncbi:MAG: CocE/NonD family hydrolase [Actinomycetota bacterium]
MRRFLIAALLAMSIPLVPSAAEVAFDWQEAYFPSGDGTILHADILRYPGTAATAKQPVILTASPYTNHASQAPPDYDPTRSGPSTRFFDFLEGSNLLARGYTYVIVDLRGFGGSGGCTDWGGPGEQADVKAAVEWAGSQPWSNGRVGVLGKSYDGWTGLMAIANRPKHLAAVVSMEPVYDGYRYLYTDGVRFSNSVATPALFVVDDATPGSASDTPEYQANGTGLNALCYALGYTGQQNDEAGSAFWQARELIKKSRGATTPLLLTQGFLETNTKPDGAFAYFAGMAGPKRAWFGQFDHVRGYEKTDGEFAVGRDGFIAEAMRLLDRYVKGVSTAQAPVGTDPAVVVQSVDGRYRAEATWPPRDTTMLRTALRTGSYPDDGNNAGEDFGDDPRKLWSISQPLSTAAHLAGEPVVHATVTTSLPRANLVANVYDIDPGGNALLISRGATLLRAEGRSTVTVPLYGQDWPIPAGHRVGVALSGANSEWWTHIPTMTDVAVESADIALPFLGIARTQFLAGQAGPRLRGFHESTFSVAAETIGAAATTFSLPRALVRPATVKSAHPRRRVDSLAATGTSAPYGWAAALALLGLLGVRTLRRSA